MDARIIDKIIEVEGRKFTIRKYPSFVAVKVGKRLTSKLLPVFQSFVPVITEIDKAYMGQGDVEDDVVGQPDSDDPMDDGEEQGEDEQEICFDVKDSAFELPSVDAATVHDDATPQPGVNIMDGALESVMDNVLENVENYLNFGGISDALDRVSDKDLDYIMHMSLMCCFEHLKAGPVQVMSASGQYRIPDLEHDAPFVLRLVCESVMFGLSDFFTADRLKSTLVPMFNLKQSSQ